MKTLSKNDGRERCLSIYYEPIQWVECLKCIIDFPRSLGLCLTRCLWKYSHKIHKSDTKYELESK